MWECGLKPELFQADLLEKSVTPYVGVWIETTYLRLVGDEGTSLLMWECGLKLRKRRKQDRPQQSLLMWECGLKQLHRFVAAPRKLSLLMWECGLKQ